MDGEKKTQLHFLLTSNTEASVSIITTTVQYIMEKVTVTLEGLFPSMCLILSKLLYPDQTDAKSSTKENTPSWTELIRENEIEWKGHCLDPRQKWILPEAPSTTEQTSPVSPFNYIFC